MKNKLQRLISALLIMAFLVSAFAVFAFAEEETEEEEEIVDSLLVMLNRTMDEGWEPTNGLSGQYKSQSFTIEHEELDDFSYNYYIKYKIVTDPTNEGAAFITLKPDASRLSGGTVLEYDIKLDCVTSGINSYMLTPGSSSDRTLITLFSITNNNYVVNNGVSGGLTVGSLAEDWLHVANVFNFDQSVVSCKTCGTKFDTDETPSCPKEECEGTDLKHYITIRTYFSYAESFDHSTAINVKDLGENESFDLYNNTYYVDSSVGVSNGPACLNEIRIGGNGGKIGNLGQGFLLDNVKLYSDLTPKDENGNPAPMDVRDDVTIEKYGYGSQVDVSKPKTVPIVGKDSGEAVSLASAMMMKVNCKYMLFNEERQPIFVNSQTGKAYGAPVKVDGIVYVPFEPLLDSTGFPVFVHDDGIQYDISTETGSSILTLYRNVAIVGGERVPLTAAPIMVQDPDDPENTYPVIAIDDLSTFFPGYFVTYDEMGLIGIGEAENLFNRYTDLNGMMTIMKKFIFDNLSAEDMYDMIDENTNGFDHPYLIADQEQFDYLNSVYLAYQAMEAGEEYDETLIDENLKSYMEPILSSANSYIKRFTTLPSNPVNYTFKEYAYLRDPGKYKMLAFEITNPFYGIREGEKYTDDNKYKWDYLGPADENGDYWGKLGEHYNDGYDWAGGRNGMGVEYALMILKLGLAYQITRDVTYAELAYDMAISLCDDNNWHHWVQGHFLSCGTTLQYMGLAFDWLYDVWGELQATRSAEYSLGYIAQSIYRKGIYHGYDTSRYGRISGVANRQDSTGVTIVNGYITSTWNWAKCDINWNGVCNSGLVISAMSIVSEDKRLEGVDFTAGDEAGVNRVMWTMSNNLNYLCNYGMAQYCPDGSYIEGASYWAYATNNIALVMWAVKTATGDDLGMYETWGMDKTFYYAVQSEYSIYKEGNYTYNFWAYHDTGGGMQDSDMFFFASQMLNDPALAAIRIQHVSKYGKGISWADLLGYKKEYGSLTMEDVTLDLDYRYEACEGVIARSSWDDGATFAGIMGNANNCGNHGQMDSGIFTYVDDGVNWFIDLGSDNYNIYKYFDYGYRQFYYRNSAEGHNLVILTSQQEALPFGQSYYGYGKITDYHSEEYGMYTVLDNSTAYAGFVNYARRGMLFTNNRETVVIQDEIAFDGAQSAAWIAHTTHNITLSDDKKTAFLTANAKGVLQCIRVSIVSPDTKLKFEIMTCNVKADGSDKLLDGLFSRDYSESMGAIAEKSRTGIQRLVIKANSTMAFNCAIVIEDVKDVTSTPPVRYEFSYINTWKESGINYSYKGDGIEGSENGGASSDVITNATLGDIRTYSAQAEKLLSSGYALSTRVLDFYRALARVSSAVNTFRPESFKNIEQVWTSYQSYLVYLEYYKSYSSSINTEFDNAHSVASGLTGI